LRAFLVCGHMEISLQSLQLVDLLYMDEAMPH